MAKFCIVVLLMGEDGDVVKYLVVEVSGLVYYVAAEYDAEPTDRVRYVLSLAFGCFRLLTGGWLVGCLHVSQDFWQRLFHVKIFVNASK
jgi:heme A synthase